MNAFKKPTVLKNKLPDFFIVGGPKCGTTALYTYLNEHPDIFMPNVKEPNYLADDLNIQRQIRDNKGYEDLFQSARPGQMTGEGSTWYLYSQNALRHIMEMRPDARIIAMVRNPVDMAISMHAQMVYSMSEDEKDFQKSWDLQEKRKKGRSIPKFCEEPAVLYYRDICALGSQLEKLVNLVPESQRRIYLFDDFIADTKSIYEDALALLGLQSDNRQNFPPVNERKIHKATGFAMALKSLSRTLRPAKMMLRKLFPGLPSSMLKPLYDLQSEKGSLFEIPEATREMLRTEFLPEIEAIEKITKRDLRHWKK